jgi:hypothetical protein
MSSLQDLINQLNSQYANTQEQLNQAYQQRANNIRNQLGGQGQYGQLGGGLQGLLNKHPGIAQPARKPLLQDPKARMAEINKELDIIRGVVPTPKGYKVDARKVKALMTELSELEKDLTK